MKVQQIYRHFVVRLSQCAALMGIVLAGLAIAQGGPRPSQLGASGLNLGEPGIAWYTTWKSAEEEAKRSGRPIMFVAAATQCNGISGVF